MSRDNDVLLRASTGLSNDQSNCQIRDALTRFYLFFVVLTLRFAISELIYQYPTYFLFNLSQISILILQTRKNMVVATIQVLYIELIYSIV